MHVGGCGGEIAVWLLKSKKSACKCFALERRTSETVDRQLLSVGV